MKTVTPIINLFWYWWFNNYNTSPPTYLLVFHTCYDRLDYAVIITIPLPSLDSVPVGLGNNLDIGLSAQYASKNIIGCG